MESATHRGDFEGIGRRFRLYSLATMVIVCGAGAWTGTFASGVQANLPTPWAGLWERVNTTAFMMWIAALAIALWRGTSKESLYCTNGAMTAGTKQRLRQRAR